MINDTENLFTDQLRAAIQDNVMSLRWIAEASAIDAAALSRFMNGKSGLSVASIDRLCKVLHLRLVFESKLYKRRKKQK